MKKQKQIAKWLKGLCIFLVVAGAAFFVGLLMLKIWGLYPIVKELNHWVLCFSGFMAILYFGVLYQFWKVCTEIGNDNSFSLENAQSFHRMAAYGIASFVSYMVRIIYFIVTAFSSYGILYALVMGILSLVFVVICEAMSQLIRNAYEVKLENDLTI